MSKSQADPTFNPDHHGLRKLFWSCTMSHHTISTGTENSHNSHGHKKYSKQLILDI